MTRMSPAPARNTSASHAVTPDFPAQRALPAWPILALLWGMPLWWAFGMLQFYTIIMAVAMLALLLQHGRVSILPGVLPWLGFVAWLLPCAIMLDSLGRFIGYGMRFSQFAAIAVALIYVTNARHSLSVGRVLTGLTFVWIFVIAGGYLGMFWPDTTLTFTVGRILPSSIVSNEYVSDIVFPKFADVQTPWGAEEPFVRPSAPFAYTNGWGAAITILTPIAAANAILRRTAWATIFLLTGVLLAIPPAVATGNRGLFVGLIAVIAYVIFRFLLSRRWLPLIWVGILSAVSITIIGLSGALAVINERQDVADTTQGRSDLYEETFARSLQSPILGYGAPRPSFTSEITVGTQGMMWNVMFSFGFVGLFLFAYFLIMGLIRTWAAPNVAAIWLHASLVAGVTISPFYGLDNHMLTLALVLGLMLREKYKPGSDFWVQNPTSYRRYAN